MGPRSVDPPGLLPPGLFRQLHHHDHGCPGIRGSGLQATGQDCQVLSPALHVVSGGDGGALSVRPAGEVYNPLLDYSLLYVPLF